MKVIRANYQGRHFIGAEGISVSAEDPLSELCRRLLKAGHPPETPLEAYSGEQQIQRVPEIGKRISHALSAW